mmetsp:Transcript_15004/g.27092  ORF Transcript_15004/g.27092 Transcript_15004/m.27092 type:complete len:87 (-) Transcript_15004:502-762(-)
MFVFLTKKGTPPVYATPPATTIQHASIGNTSIISGTHTMQLHPMPRYMASENNALCFHVRNSASTTIPLIAHTQMNSKRCNDHIGS